jgi:hypothetical protein
VIINDQLTQEETHRLITILEKHHSAFGYSLQDLKASVIPFALIAFLLTLIFYQLESHNEDSTIQ